MDMTIIILAMAVITSILMWRIITLATALAFGITGIFIVFLGAGISLFSALLIDLTEKRKAK